MLAREELAGTQAPFPVQGLRGEIILFSQTQDSPNLPFSRKPPLKVMVRVGGGVGGSTAPSLLPTVWQPSGEMAGQSTGRALT